MSANLSGAAVRSAPRTRGTGTNTRRRPHRRAWPRRHYPSWWLAQAHCIHHEETQRSWSSGWHIWWVYPSHAPSSNRGGFQINVATWAAFAPARWTRDPARASRAQQVLVAWRIWLHNGRSWGANGQWPGTAAACGIR